MKFVLKYKYLNRILDMHGNVLKYDPKVSHPNRGGVLATISKEAQDWYLSKVPDSVRTDPDLQP